jgi:hypothetical protein
MVYRLRIETGYDVELVSRAEVKKWVFDTFTDVCVAAIRKKVDKKMYLCCDLSTKELVWLDAFGKSRRKENFTQVDDKVVTEAMKFLYKIPTPKPGDGYKFGLKDHSWQALALANLYKSRCL